jgi:hypothetical protein
MTTPSRGSYPLARALSKFDARVTKPVPTHVLDRADLEEVYEIPPPTNVTIST